MVIEARLAGQDAVRRTVRVRPTGVLRTEVRRGTLGRDRSFRLTLPRDVDPATARVRLSVFAGALAVLRSERSTVLAREDAASAAYALLLAGRGPGLLQRLGGPVDPAEFRRLRLLATQRAVRANRTPSPEVAALFAEGALAHPGEPLLERLGLRLARWVAGRQRPDGTFGGQTGWTVQRLLVATADGLGVVRSAQRFVQGSADRDAPVPVRGSGGDSVRGSGGDSVRGSGGDSVRGSAGGSVRGFVRRTGQRWIQASTVRANGAFERLYRRINDPYTAAVVASSGGTAGPMLEALRQKVREALETRPDGSRVLEVPPGAVRPDGRPPTRVEATAYAALALAEADPARIDLGSALVAAYQPGGGWGDGRTSLVALRAVLDVFRAAVPEVIDVEVGFDDRRVIETQLAGPSRFDVVTARVVAPGRSGPPSLHGARSTARRGPWL